MEKFLVEYTKIPTNFNDTHTMVVEAESEFDARTIAKHHLNDLGSLDRNDYRVRPYEAPPRGRVVGSEADEVRRALGWEIRKAMPYGCGGAACDLAGIRRILNRVAPDDGGPR